MSRWNVERAVCQDIASQVGTRCFTEEQKQLMEFTIGTQTITIEDLFNHYYGDRYLTFSKQFTYKAIAIKNKEHEYLFDQLKVLNLHLEELLKPENFRELVTNDLKTNTVNTETDNTVHKDTLEETSKSDQGTRGTVITRTLTGERSKQITGLEDIDDLRRIDIAKKEGESSEVQNSNIDYNKHGFDRSSTGTIVDNNSTTNSTTNSTDEVKRDSAQCGSTEQSQYKSVKSREILEAVRTRIPEIRTKIMNLYYDLFKGYGAC